MMQSAEWKEWVTKGRLYWLEWDDHNITAMPEHVTVIQVQWAMLGHKE